jgi:hypothetical protein
MASCALAVTDPQTVSYRTLRNLVVFGFNDVIRSGTAALHGPIPAAWR